MQNVKYLPERLMEILPLTEERVIRAWKERTDLVVKIKGWNDKLKGLEIESDEFSGLIPLGQITIYPITSETDQDVTVLIDKKCVCKVIDIDLKNKKLLLSRKDAMKEALEFLKKQNEIPFADILVSVDETAFVDIGYGIKGKIKIRDFTCCKFYSIADAGCIRGKTFPMSILMHNEENNIFKLSYIKQRKNFDDSISSKFKEGDIIECKIGSELGNKTGFFVEILPNVSGIVDTKKYDFLLDEDGDFLDSETIPPLIYGRRAKILIRKIKVIDIKNSNPRIKIKGRFISYV